MPSQRTVTNRPFGPVEDPGLDNDPTTYLTRVFVYFLQNLFRDFPEGSGMRWRPEEENTEIVISAEKPRSDSLEKTPHITCVLGASRWANLSLDQLQNVRSSDGQRTHTDLVAMTMAYHCQAKEGLVARRIAWNCSFYTNVFRRLIMRGGGLHHVAPNHEISAESAASTYTGPTAEDEFISVVVTVPFYWQPQWRITRPANLWNKLRVDLHVNQGLAQNRSTVVRPPSINGKPLYRVEPPKVAFTQVIEEVAYGDKKEE